MAMIRKIAENSVVIILGDIVDSLINFIAAVLLARYFGQSLFGTLSFLATFFFFLGAVDNQWIRPILIREITRDKINAGRIIGNGLIIKTLISLSAIILFWITLGLISVSNEIIILAIFTSLGLFLSSLVSSYETIFQASLKVKRFIGLSIFSKLLNIALVCLVVYFKQSLFNFYVLSLIPGIILLILVRNYSRKIIIPDFKIDIILWRKIFRLSWPLGLTAAFIFIYHRLDQVFLLHIKGAAELGSYSVAVKLAEILNIIPIALSVSILPLMSVYFKTSTTNLIKTYQLSFKYLLFFIIPIAVWASCFSGNIISSLYGKQFLSSGPALAILIWAEIFVYVGLVNNAILVATDKQILDPLFTGTSAAINIVLNMILIPRYGLIGAAISSLLSYSVGPVMGYFFRSTRPYSSSMLHYSLKPFCAASFMFLFIYYTRSLFWVSFLTSPFVYVLVFFLIKGIDKVDIKLVKSVFSNSR